MAEDKIEKWGLEPEQHRILEEFMPGIIKKRADGTPYFEATEQQASAYRRLIQSYKTTPPTRSLSDLESRVTESSVAVRSTTIGGINKTIFGAMAGAFVGALVAAEVLLPLIEVSLLADASIYGPLLYSRMRNDYHIAMASCISLGGIFGAMWGYVSKLSGK